MRIHLVFLNTFVLLAAILLVPMLATGLLWRRTLRAVPDQRQTLWIVSLRRIRILLLCMAAVWWALWDIERSGSSGWPFTEAGTAGFLLFVGPPISITFMVQLVSSALNRDFLGDRWATTDLLRLALCGTASPLAAEMVAAVGFTDLYSRRLLGLLWMALSVALVAMGTIGVRLAQGLRFRKVKSGDLYKRTLYWARQMKIPVKNVMMVPPGRGQLTNAYSLGRGSIAMTENYSKFLSGAQLDAVIGHELGHAKHRHGSRRLAAIAGVYGILVVASMYLPHSLFPARPLIDIGIVFAPVLINRFISRRFEFEADRDAVALTQNPQMTILALENLYRFVGVPESTDWLTELFATHPSLVRRIEAIRQNAAAQKGVAVS